MYCFFDSHINCIERLTILCWHYPAGTPSWELLISVHKEGMQKTKFLTKLHGESCLINLFSLKIRKQSMEGLLNSLLNQSCFKPFGLTPKLSYTFPVITRTGIFNLKLEPCICRSNCTHIGRDTASSSRGFSIYEFDSNEKGEKCNMDWELEFLGELDPFGYRTPKRRKEQKSKLETLMEQE